MSGSLHNWLELLKEHQQITAVLSIAPPAKQLESTIQQATEVGDFEMEIYLRLHLSNKHSIDGAPNIAFRQIARCEELAHTLDSESLKSFVLFHKGRLLFHNNRYSESRNAFSLCIKFFEKHDLRNYLVSRIYLPMIDRLTGNWSKGILRAAMNLKIAEKLADPYLIGLTHNNYSVLLLFSNKACDSLPHIRQAMLIASDIGNERLYALASVNLAIYLSYFGMLQSAIRHLSEALEYFRKLQVPSKQRSVLNALGLIQVIVGNSDKALQYLTESASIESTRFDPFDRGRNCLYFALSFEEQGQLERFDDYLARAEEIYRETEYELTAYEQLTFAYCYIKGAMYEEAITHLKAFYNKPEDEHTRLGKLTANCLDILLATKGFRDCPLYEEYSCEDLPMLLSQKIEILRESGANFFHKMVEYVVSELSSISVFEEKKLDLILDQIVADSARKDRSYLIGQTLD